ncbi:MAG TPA: NAD(P)H-dependent oxidoreductase [Chitinophagaceae bacterium]|nr:NAD(P)H-dependent oxidoreductase [Chitinophagaceae bacterium]
MKTAIIIGSIRTGRQSQKIAWYLEKKLKKKGVEVDMIDLKDYPLPLLEERVHIHMDPPANAVELSGRLYEADSLILVSPEYHGSYSGVLKNALDYFRTEFSRKVIGVVTTSGGKFGGINASHQLQDLVLHVGAYPMPVKLLVPEIHFAFDADNNLLPEALQKSTQQFVDEFVWFASAISTARHHKKEKELV